MLIIVSFANYIRNLRRMMDDIDERLQFVKHEVFYDQAVIEIEEAGIIISFLPDITEKIKGTRPDYYWTNSGMAEDYYKYVAKRLNDFELLTSVIAFECFEKGVTLGNGKLETTQLKTCPCCGSDAIYDTETKSDGYTHYEVGFVKCQVCGLQTRHYVIDGYYGSETTIEYAAKDWNRRV